MDLFLTLIGRVINLGLLLDFTFCEQTELRSNCVKIWLRENTYVTEMSKNLPARKYLHLQ